MDPVLEALEEQQAELAHLLSGLREEQWHAPTRCEGWDVADVVLHLSQSDEMAIASITGRFDEYLVTAARGSSRGEISVDRAAAYMVERERGVPPAELRERWGCASMRLVEVLEATDLSERVPWVAGQLSARTLATTRMAETWIHAWDVADALGTELVPSDRLRLVARLAWRTLTYAFESAGRSMHGPAAFLLTSPQGEAWEYLPDVPAATTITGPAFDLCAVAARRARPSDTSLSGVGPDVEEILALVRTYA
ncbi:MAG TPA: maleylpyruvate isomerase family mycothiol-dependent enzyme [Acidimicrobiales bacterium]|nr:maleylpyruvate isomerase family mycothiol-dependent enzyme [Acidimicrobiales bacterium]